MKFQAIALLTLMSAFNLSLSGCGDCDPKIFGNECSRPHVASSHSLKSFKISTERKELRSNEGENIELTRFNSLEGITVVKEAPDGSVFLGGGYGGAIVRSRPDDKDWHEINLNAGPFFIRDFHFFNTNKIIAVGDDGRIYRSNDSGEDWELYNPGFFGANNPRLEALRFDTAYSIAFANDNYGLIGGTERLLKTVNGGEEWYPINPHPQPIFQKIILKKNFTGWAATNKGLFATKDGGYSWEKILFVVRGLFEEPVSALALDYVENSLICVSFGPTVMYSTDEAHSFHESNIDWLGTHNGYGITSLKMLNKKQGWFVTDAGQIYMTKDGAQTWNLWADIQNYFQHESTCKVLSCYRQVELWDVKIAGKKIYAAGQINTEDNDEHSRLRGGTGVLLSWKKPLP